MRAAQNRELSKADQKLGIYLYDRDGHGSMMFQHRVQRVIEFEELDAYRNIHAANSRSMIGAWGIGDIDA